MTRSILTVPAKYSCVRRQPGRAAAMVSWESTSDSDFHREAFALDSNGLPLGSQQPARLVWEGVVCPCVGHCNVMSHHGGAACCDCCDPRRDDSVCITCALVFLCVHAFLDPRMTLSSSIRPRWHSTYADASFADIDFPKLNTELKGSHSRGVANADTTCVGSGPSHQRASQCRHRSSALYL